MVTPLQRLIVPLIMAALVCLGGLCLGQVYNGALLAWLIAGAGIASVLVSVLMRRSPGWLVATVSVAALLAYAVLAVYAAARAGGVDGDLRLLAFDAARNAVPRLLTALIPVEAQPDTVLGPVVLAWLAGFAAAELAVRAGRPAVGLLPPTLFYTGALVLVGPNASTSVWLPLAFIGLAAAALVIRGARRAPSTAPVADRETPGPWLRTVTGAGAGLVTVLAAVAIAAPLVAGTVTRTPTDPRRYVRPPSLDVLDQNPLIRISGWAANPQQRLFDVTVLSGADQRPRPPQPTLSPRTRDESVQPAEPTDKPASEPDAEAPIPDPTDGAHDTRLRLAVLADWDGVTWHVEADYRGAGRVLPAVAAPPGFADDASMRGPARTIQERITVAELSGRMLPAVSSPRRVDGVRVAYDVATGTLLHTERLATGLTYTVTSVNPSVDVDLLPAADVPSGQDVARYLAVGDAVPADLARLAEQISTGEGSPYLRALALETFLAEHYRFAADAPSGHAYPNLRFFLFADQRAGGRQGTSEQFAASFAALGRLLGLPTRVVVGFRTPAGGGAVTGADAVAWPEALFAGVGWVAFDPMPKPDTPSRPVEDEFLPKPPPPTSPPASVEPTDEPTWSAPSARGPAAGEGRAGPRAAVIAGGVGGTLVVLVLCLLAIGLLRIGQRRRRLDRGSPPQRVLGAWREVLDALALAGASPPAHLAAGEVAEHAGAVAKATPGRRHARRPRPAAPQLGELASLVNAVSFGAPVGGAPVADDSTAAAATTRATGYAMALRARRPLWRRLLWRVDPRPLWRR